MRCDGQKPACANCLRRGNACTYEPEPRRRGPAKKKPEGKDEGEDEDEDDDDDNRIISGGLRSIFAEKNIFAGRFAKFDDCCRIGC